MNNNDNSFSSDFASEERKSSCTVPVPGEFCPVCGKGKMEYDGTLILTCPECGFQAPGGGFT